MKEVRFSVYELRDLERLLERLIEYIASDTKRVKNNYGFDDREYDIGRIKILLSRIRGKDYNPNYLIQRQEYKEDLGGESTKAEKEIGRINIWR